MIFTLLYGWLCLFRFAKAWKLFIYGCNKEKSDKNCWKLMPSEGWKCYFRDPYILKSSGGACPRTTLAAHSFGARDWLPPPPPPINLTLLRHCSQSLVSYLNISPHPTVLTSTYEPLLGTSLQHGLLCLSWWIRSLQPYHPSNHQLPTMSTVLLLEQWNGQDFHITLYIIIHTPIVEGKLWKL